MARQEEGCGLSRGSASTRVLKQAGLGGVGGLRGGSVVFNGGQVRVQIHADVFVEAAEGDKGAITKIVEAVQVLPLFGVPQQFIPEQVTQISHQQDRRASFYK